MKQWREMNKDEQDAAVFDLNPYNREARAVDRSLQRLRKSGKIQYLGGSRREWGLASGVNAP